MAQKLKSHYPVVIVGAGIVGAGIFRDLCLHHIDCLIIDKKDFSSQTSQSSSKMLHGGIRYLENMDFALIFEALHEKNLWLKIAPELAEEKEFILPIYENSKRPLWQMAIGLFIYDLLSNFKNKPFKILNPVKTLEREPKLNPQGLKGCGIYADAIIDDAKMTLHALFDGKKSHPNSDLKNYTSLKFADLTNKKIHAILRDEVTKQEIEITCDHMIFALGPFTDEVMKNFTNIHWNDVLLPSKGSHIWIKKDKLNISGPLVMTSHNNEDRVIFVIPHHDKVLVGTTELKTKESFFDVKISKEEVQYLLRHLNDYFPNQNITESDIITSYSGIRPLVKEDGDNLGKTSREHKIYRPTHHSYVIAGGKYTTFRVMGQEITRSICQSYHRPFNHELSKLPMNLKTRESKLKVSSHDQFDLEYFLEYESPKTFTDLVKRRLGIESKYLWVGKTSFDEFFIGQLPLINRYFPCSVEDIQSFA